MPVHTVHTQDHVAVSGPIGTRYARGSSDLNTNVRLETLVTQVVVIAAGRAIENALHAFRREFGTMPSMANMVIEVVPSEYEMTAVVLEIVRNEGVATSNGGVDPGAA